MKNVDARRRFRREIAAERRCPICAAPAVTRGFCGKHYRRLLRNGTTADGPRARRPLVERFWLRVRVGMAAACWPWLGARSNGYGMIKVHTGRDLRTHRVAYM